MNKIDIGKAVGVLANLGVIAGIVFLAIEIHQNNEQLATQSREYQYDLYRSARIRYLDNLALIDVTVKARRGESLTESEEILLRTANLATIEDFQFLFQEYQRGALRQLSVAEVQGTFLNAPGLLDLWESDWKSRRSAYVTFVNEALASPVSE